MKEPRFYCDSISADTAKLSGSEAHHLINVFRLKVGAEVELFDGAGTLAKAVVSDIKSGQVELKVEQVRTVERANYKQVIIAASVAKGERFDMVISKCTELGVDAIIPVLFERTVKLAKGKAVWERYNKLAIAAAKQCGRIFLPKIFQPCNLEESIKKIGDSYPESAKFFGSLEVAAPPLIEIDTGQSCVANFIGPEGGLTKTEEDILLAQGFQPVRLTETTLRTETAALTFAAILAAKRDADRRKFKN